MINIFKIRISKLAFITVGSIIFFAYTSMSIAADKIKKENQIPNVKTFKDWSYMCEPINKDSKDSLCYIAQAVSAEFIDQKTKKKTSTKIADYKIGYFPDDKGKKTIKFIETLPLGSLIAPGTGIVNSKGEVAKGSYSFCHKDGCVAVSEVNEDTIKKIISSDKCVVAFIAADGKQVNLPIALDGLDEAFKYLKANLK